MNRLFAVASGMAQILAAPARVCLLLSLVAALPANANDSVAELRPGGLVFITSDTIVMEREELRISPGQIRVDYVFRNTAEVPQTVTVAFPMPVIEGNPWIIPAIPQADSANFLDFSVTVDGKAVTPKLQQRAEIAGIDVTDVLRTSGLPLEPFAQATKDAVAALTEEAKREFLRRGLLIVDTYDNDGTGMKDHYMPYWSVRTTFHWEMTFKPGVETLVSHTYTPSVGGTAGISFVENDKFSGRQFDLYRRRYCMDDAFLAAVQKGIASSDPMLPAFVENRIAYVLTTGKNWAGPIRSFNLTIDKEHPDSLVSFCADGVTKTGPTTFEVRYQDYYPESDLDILILSRPR
jgi:hypothetical protein